MIIRVLSSLSKPISIISNSVKCMSYKSYLSLDNIYPNSGTIQSFKPPESQEGKFTGYIPIKDLKITYTKASGPGGQHVNKTETKVDIRFHVKSATWLSESTKEKLINKFYTRINKDGFFIVKSEKTRSQLLNTADAMAYLRELIFKLEEPEPTPKLETLEKIRKNKEKAARNRLLEKRKRSLDKAQKRLEVIY